MQNSPTKFDDFGRAEEETFLDEDEYLKDDFEDWDEDGYDRMESECGALPDGGCIFAGAEYCDWECPFGGLA